MGRCTSELEVTSECGNDYRITVHTVILENWVGGGAGRLVVKCRKPGIEDAKDREISQDVHLSAAECRALANMLSATADLIEERASMAQALANARRRS